MQVGQYATGVAFLLAFCANLMRVEMAAGRSIDDAGAAAVGTCLQADSGLVKLDLTRTATAPYTKAGVARIIS